MLIRKDDLPGFHELSSDVATVSQDRGWKTFLLAGYGFKSQANIQSSPETWRICQKIPGLITVMFSILEPGKHLPPDRGPYNRVLRLHLGLIVPEPREQLGIRVEKASAFPAALAQALAAQRPAVIDVVTDIDALAPVAVV